MPRPRAEEAVLVAVAQVGVCGTDHKIFAGTIPVAYPRVLGHEVVGWVADGGSAQRVGPGDRVLVDPSSWCGSCWLCLHGLEHLCGRGHLLGRDRDGGMAEMVAVEERALHRLPDALTQKEAPLLQVLGTCVHAHRLIEIFPGDIGVVVGLGVAGLLHVQLLRMRGVGLVIGVTRSALKRELARSLGASAVAAPAEAAALVAEATNGRGGDIVVEAVGEEATLAHAIRLTRPGGTVLVFGTITGGRGDLPYYDLYYKELRVVNSRAARAADYDDAIGLMTSGKVKGAPLVTSWVPLDQGPAILSTWGKDPGQLKVVLDV